MDEDVDRKEIQTTIRHLENQAGSILRLIITFIGVGVSGTSIVLTVFFTSNLSVDFKFPTLATIVENFSNHPAIGNDTALVAAFLLLIGVVCSFVFTFFAFFIWAPIRSLEVLEPFAGNASKVKSIDNEIQGKKDAWRHTVLSLKYGFISLYGGVALSITLFVSRYAEMALLGLFVLVILIWATLRRFGDLILWPLRTWSRIDAALVLIALPITFLIFAPTSSPIIDKYLPYGMAVASVVIGDFRNRLLGEEMTRKIYWRDLQIVTGLLAFSLPVIIVAEENFGGDVATMSLLIIVVLVIAFFLSFISSLVTIILMLIGGLIEEYSPWFRKISSNFRKSIGRKR